MKKTVYLIITFLVPLLLLGCAGSKFHRAEVATRAKTELVGMSKKDLLSCAGVPVRSQQVEDMEFLTYVGGGDNVGYAGGAAGSSAAGGVIAMHKRYCEVTFVLKAGKVEKVNYTGRTGGWATKGEQCAFVIENCLKDK
jgi:hypothetical protein